MSTAADLRATAVALRDLLKQDWARPLPEQVTQGLAAAQFSLDHAALELDAADDHAAQLREDLQAVDVERAESVARASRWHR